MNRASETDELPFLVPVPEKLRGLLKDVSKFIVQHPDQFDMNDWVNPFGTSCGTVGCIAGHMALRDTPQEVVAAAIDKMSEQSTALYASDWNAWAKKYSSTKSLSAIVRDWRTREIPDKLSANFRSLFLPDNAQWEPYRTNVNGYSTITAEGAAKRIDAFLKASDTVTPYDTN